jgi:predicted membrane protein
VAYVGVLGSPLTHLSLIVFIGSSERAILVCCIVRIASSGTRCSSCKPVVLVTLGGCHLLDDLLAWDSVEARKKIVRGSEETL